MALLSCGNSVINTADRRAISSAGANLVALSASQFSGTGDLKATVNKGA